MLRRQGTARLFTFTAVCVSAVLLSGCQAMSKLYTADEITTVPTDSGLITGGKINLAAIKPGEFDGQTHVGERKRLGMLMLDLSDRACTLHKATIYSNSANWNIAAGVGTIFLSGYASVVDNAKRASNAAALSAAVAGTHATVNQEVYQAKVGTAIARAIDVLRERELSAVQVVMANPDATAAELVAAVNRYHSRCSLIEGVSELTRAVDNQRPTVQELANRRTALKLEADQLRSKQDRTAEDTRRMESYYKAYDEMTLPKP